MPKHFLGDRNDLDVKVVCPSCGAEFNSTNGLDTNGGPKANDIGLCVVCGDPHIVQEDFTLRPMTKQDFDGLTPEVRSLLRMGQQALKEANEAKEAKDPVGISGILGEPQELDVPNQKCPACGGDCDMTSGVGGTARPFPGAIAICFMCGVLQTFDDNMALRLLSDEEFESLPTDQQEVIKMTQQLAKETMAWLREDDPTL